MGTVPPDAEIRTWCPQCGPHVYTDEDGCCLTCGATATWQGADAALAALVGKPAEVPWRSDPPTVDEIKAHDGLWMESDAITNAIAVVRLRDQGSPNAALDCYPTPGVIMRSGCQWRPVDRDGVPVPWPVVTTEPQSAEEEGR